MCGRYYIASEDQNEEIRQLIEELNRKELENNKAPSFRTGEVFPGDQALVVANNRRLETRPFVMKWGFSGRDKSLLINARSETAHEKAMFKELISMRRVLIPASYYFEWEKQGKTKTKYAITTDAGCIFMAGLYRPNIDRSGHEFVILTRDAAPDIRFIHERMPVALSREAARAWLSRDADYDRIIKDAMTRVTFRKAEGM